MLRCRKFAIIVGAASILFLDLLAPLARDVFHEAAAEFHGIHCSITAKVQRQFAPVVTIGVFSFMQAHSH